VRVLPSEREAVLAAAAAISAHDALDGDTLRQVHGRCIFLRDDRRCALHAHGGASAKPAVCRQYPLVVVRTESGDRAAIDPGCYTHRATWHGDALLDATGATHVVEILYDEAHARFEAAVLARLGGADDTRAAIDTLVPGGAAPGFAERWLAAARAGPLASHLDAEDAAPAQRAVLAPLLRGAAPARPLGAEDEEFALDVATRVVALRLLPAVPPPEAALLALGGALLASTVDRAGAVGPVLAAWTRGIRARGFLAAARAVLSAAIAGGDPSPGGGR
jgi:Fe-S-cluster containining protein